MREEKNAANRKYAIEIQGLTKSFGSRLALKGIDLKMSEGECVTIFGPNGAGKTTLIKVLATLSKPSDGKVHLAGLNIRKDAVPIRRKIGVVSHQTFLYDNLTTYENLKFYGIMYDVSNLEQRILEVIDLVGIKARLHDRVGILSRGMQQRLSIARAIIHNPSIMLLDEPETGLDQHAVTMLSELLTAVSSGNRTTLMTTHNLERGLELANRVMILDSGRIVYEESKQHLELASLRDNYYRCTGVKQ